MKIYLSKSWVNAIIVVWVVFIVGNLILLYPRIIKGTYGFLLFLSLLFAMEWLLITFLLRKYFSYVVVNDNIYQSYFLKQQLCQINGNQKIYYALIKTYENSREIKPYIVLSEQKFQLPENTRKLEHGFLTTYDWKKLILLPYNDQTVQLIDVSMWELVF